MFYQPRRTAELIIMALTELGSAQVSPKLHPREEQSRIPSPRRGLSLFLRYLPPSRTAELRRAVVYVHGGTFPSGLSIAHRLMADPGATRCVTQVSPSGVSISTALANPIRIRK
jgi:hypothetical protein